MKKEVPFYPHEAMKTITFKDAEIQAATRMPVVQVATYTEDGSKLVIEPVPIEFIFDSETGFNTGVKILTGNKSGIITII
jgi:hypothetical protein